MVPRVQAVSNSLICGKQGNRLNFEFSLKKDGEIVNLCI